MPVTLEDRACAPTVQRDCGLPGIRLVSSMTRRPGKVAHIHDCIHIRGRRAAVEGACRSARDAAYGQLAAKDQARSAEGAACRAGGAGEGGGADGRREGAEARRGIFTAGGGRQGKDPARGAEKAQGEASPTTREQARPRMKLGLGPIHRSILVNFAPSRLRLYIRPFGSRTKAMIGLVRVSVSIVPPAPKVATTIDPSTPAFQP